MKFKELKNKSEKDLSRILGENQDTLRDLRFKGANDQVKNVRQLRVIKRTIQRINFLLSQKTKSAEPAKEIKDAK